jgi:hypothetical protein
MPWPLYPQGKSPWYPLDRRLGGPQRWSGYGGKEKNSQPLPGLEPPIIQTIAQHCTTGVGWNVGSDDCFGDNAEDKRWSTEEGLQTQLLIMVRSEQECMGV